MNRLLYAVHKWISAAAFLQLTVWTISGFAFTVITQESIRGASVEGAHRAPLDGPPEVPMARAMEVASARAGAIDRVELRATPSGVFYVVHGESATVRVDARRGELAPVEREEAESIARRDQPGAPGVREAARIEKDPPIDYRECTGDCTLPVWRVALADARGTVVYVDAATGDVNARRNDRWRTYDFLWSLHIMDYRAREDFNHALIRGAAILAMATVLSGIVLLAIRAGRWLRKRVATLKR